MSIYIFCSGGSGGGSSTTMSSGRKDEPCSILVFAFDPFCTCTGVPPPANALDPAAQLERQMRRLYVGNLPPFTPEEQIKLFFCDLMKACIERTLSNH